MRASRCRIAPKRLPAHRAHRARCPGAVAGRRGGLRAANASARHRKIDLNLIVMANPRVALHEVDAGLQGLSSPSREKPRQVCRIEDRQGNAEAMIPGGEVQLAQVLRERLEIDGEVRVSRVDIELDFVTELVLRAGRQGHRPAGAVDDRRTGRGRDGRNGPCIASTAVTRACSIA